MSDEDIRAFEGLVGKTAEMFAEMVGLERDDMRQELRIKVVKARRAYDSRRSTMTERAYVYSCVANFVKDLKRDAARRSSMRVDFIEDQTPHSGGDSFEFRYLNLSQEDAYAAIEGFVLPETITEEEHRVMLLLVSGYLQSEIARMQDESVWRVMRTIESLREKLGEKLSEFRPPAPAAPLALPLPADDLVAAA